MADLSTPEGPKVRRQLEQAGEIIRANEATIAGLREDYRLSQEALSRIAAERDEARQAVDAFADICDELGCERDNEAGLTAAASLKERASAAERERDELKAEVERLMREALALTPSRC